MISDKAVALLKHHEGYMQFLYNDKTGKRVQLDNGNPTIGYGLNLNADGFTEQESEYLLRNRLTGRDDRLQVLLPFYNRLDPVRQAVLLDMSYQMGVEGLMGFTGMLGYIDARKWNQASVAMADSDWGREFPKRLQNLSGMMITGLWPDFLKGVL